MNNNNLLSDIAVKIDNISKSYKLYNNPIDRLKESLHPLRKKYHHDFYALKDISFEIKKGETIGIIGQNGSGKSTLLKVITGVLTPSSGSVIVNGRVSAILELGAGFNPELTGIENIYLNGTITGFSKEELDRRLDDLISFADIGEFINQPVKMYSSGMFVRLAFALAINVDPDILIIDEALAVGDARFQLKCSAKLENLKNKGITIILVSHSIEQVKSLCSRAVLLNKGGILSLGDPKDVAVKYLDLLFPQDKLSEEINIKIENSNENEKIKKNDYYIEVFPEKEKGINTFGKGGAIAESVLINGLKKPNLIEGGEALEVIVKHKWIMEVVEKYIKENDLISNLICGVSFSDKKGFYLFGCTTYDKGIMIDPFKKSEIITKFCFKIPCFISGDYFINVAFALGTQENHIQLKWYDGLILLNLTSSKKYIYGLLYNDYSISIL